MKISIPLSPSETLFPELPYERAPRAHSPRISRLSNKPTLRFSSLFPELDRDADLNNAINKCVARLQLKEARISTSEFKIVEHKDSETIWTVRRDNLRLEIIAKNAGREPLVKTETFENLSAAKAAYTLALKGIEEAGRNEAKNAYHQSKVYSTNATGRRVNKCKNPLRSETEATELFKSVKNLLAKKLNSDTRQFQGTIDPAELESISNLAAYNACLTWVNPETTSQDEKLSKLSTWVTQCVNFRVRDLIAEKNARHLAAPLFSVDATFEDDEEANSGYDQFGQDSLTPSQLCEENEFRSLRNFARRGFLGLFATHPWLRRSKKAGIFTRLWASLLRLSLA